MNLKFVTPVCWPDSPSLQVLVRKNHGLAPKTDDRVSVIPLKLGNIKSLRLSQRWVSREGELQSRGQRLDVRYEKPLPANGKLVPEGHTVVASSWFWDPDGTFDGFEHEFRATGPKQIDTNNH